MPKLEHKREDPVYGLPEEKGDFINRILDRLKRWKIKLEEIWYHVKRRREVRGEGDKQSNSRIN